MTLAKQQPGQSHAGDADRQGIQPLRGKEQAHVAVPEQSRVKPGQHLMTSMPVTGGPLGK